MEYNDLEQLRSDWMSGTFEYPQDIQVAGIPYKLRSSSEQEFEDIIIRGKKGFIIYQTSVQHRDEAKEAGMHQWVVFVWGADDKYNVRPYDIRTMPPHHAPTLQTEGVERIGDVAILKIQLPSGVGALKGKIDTGAEISSLHADKIEVLNGTVKFINKELSDNVISIPVAEKQAVKSADGGVEYRPVIELDIEINDKPVRGALFNLNDRDHMEYPVLIGQNVLEKTNFLVDVKQDDPEAEPRRESDESMDDDGWKEFEFLFPEVEPLSESEHEYLQEQFADLEPAEFLDSDHTQKVEVLYKALQEADITFMDLVRLIRTDARKVLEDIEY